MKSIDITKYFSISKSYINHMTKVYGIKLHYLPFKYAASYYDKVDHEVEKTIDVLFYGTIPNKSRRYFKK